MMMPHKHEGGESEYDCRSCQDAFGPHAERRTLEERVIAPERELRALRASVERESEQLRIRIAAGF